MVNENYLENAHIIFFILSLTLIIVSLIKVAIVLENLGEKDKIKSYESIDSLFKIMFLTFPLVLFLFFIVGGVTILIPETNFKASNNLLMLITITFIFELFSGNMVISLHNKLEKELKEKNKDNVENEKENKLSIDDKMIILKDNLMEITLREKPCFKISNGAVIFKEVNSLYENYLENYIDVLYIVREINLDIDQKLKHHIEVDSFNHFLNIEYSIKNLSNTELFKETLRKSGEEMESLKETILEFSNKKIELKEQEMFSKKIGLYN